MPAGVLLEELSWVDAEKALTRDAIVVIPLGAAAKEHGPHLQLRNDWVLAEYLKQQVARQSDVVMAPTINYFYYPAFTDYPGSVCLSLETSTRLVMEVCHSLAKHGPRRFYVINTGIAPLHALRPAAQNLQADGILLSYTEFERAIALTAREVSEQEGGSHADEIETSMMLFIAPQCVDMSRAAKDFDKTGSGYLSRTRGPGVTFSPTGIWGDATLATVDKGERVVKSLLAAVLSDIQELRKKPLPPVQGR